jgi:N-acetylglucosamine-6-phosphate deacetylase
MIYSNARVLNKNYIFERKDINIVDGVVIKPRKNEVRMDGTDYSVVPALLDIHSHGSLGYCANDATKEAYDTMDKYMIEQGIQGYLPTLITDDQNRMIEICAKYAKYHENNICASCGIYMEGPFINPVKKGAHNEKYIINPDIEIFKRMYDASQGLIKVVTVAPELPNAIQFIKEASKLCRIAIGHSAADYETTKRAFDAGAINITHLFNAMNPMDHRNPGIIAAARDSGAYVELICDGIHVHPSVIRMVFSAFNKDKIILISDSISATGLKDGIYSLGGLKIIVKDNTSRLEDDTLAGSTTNLLNCIKKAVEFGISLEDALRAASINPSNLINQKNSKMIILDRNLNIKDD